MRRLAAVAVAALLLASCGGAASKDDPASDRVAPIINVEGDVKRSPINPQTLYPDPGDECLVEGNRSVRKTDFDPRHMLRCELDAKGELRWTE